MMNRIYSKRFSFFLCSFLIMLFGDMLFPSELKESVVTILLLQNMLCSYLLFLERSKREKIFIGLVIAMGFITRLNQSYFQEQIPFFFASIYFIYFGLISFRLFKDLSIQKEVDIEAIAGVFCGFILLGVVSSIVFVSLDGNMEAFKGLDNKREFSDFLYFSFITLLTIGYGDIVPTLEVSRKLVVLVSLLGHFYTIFVTAIILGKYLNRMSQKEP